MKSDFKPVGAALEKILAKYGMQDVYNLQILKDKWHEIDKTVAIHSSPVGYDKQSKKLTVKVENESWKEEFHKNRNLLKSRIQIKFKNIDIKDLEII